LESVDHSVEGRALGLANSLTLSSVLVARFPSGALCGSE